MTTESMIVWLQLKVKGSKWLLPCAMCRLCTSFDRHRPPTTVPTERPKDWWRSMLRIPCTFIPAPMRLPQNFPLISTATGYMTCSLLFKVEWNGIEWNRIESNALEWNVASCPVHTSNSSLDVAHGCDVMWRCRIGSDVNREQAPWWWVMDRCWVSHEMGGCELAFTSWYSCSRMFCKSTWCWTVQSNISYIPSNPID